uniref:PCRF domain-containing protein n=1 Tax=Angiostrongylus cantonensis TaxID=6313 RepID=A0A0K0DM25_ANGCA
MMDTAMIRDSDKSALQQGLSDALQMLKGTPLFEEGVEDYLEVLDAVEKLDIQLKKDSDVLGKMCEMLPSRMDSRMEDLVRQYEEM